MIIIHYHRFQQYDLKLHEFWQSIFTDFLMKLKDVPDSELISLLRADNSQAMDVLYDRYAGLVYSVAKRILQNNSDAEELTQDIFISLWQKDSYQAGRGSLKSFLGLLTRHRAIDKLRKRKTAQNFLERWQLYIYESSSDLMPLESAQDREQQEKLQKALSLLPTEQREILMMNFFEGLSRVQIAERLDLPVGTVKSRVRLAFVKLKRLLIEQNQQ
ncbi:MAG: sigma-70 family RNA polymerase sigma factor [Xenococcaceae cyanobacterium MO_207.B15]|nr:sigma-70 family RNA polymerase sigma factor [Xenococcaceae cyanobacterium MO_207.B15]